MDYDDHYTTAQGEYWSFASMNITQKIIYICNNVWIVLNILTLTYLGFKMYKLLQHTIKIHSNKI